MKKMLSILAMALLLSIPLSANASYLGNGYLDSEHGGLTGGGYYLDYEGAVTSSNFGYTTGVEEIFCVSSEDRADANFDFYTITNDLDTLLSIPGLFANMSKAAWIADNWTTYSGWSATDYYKGEAQKAIWKTMAVMDIMDEDGADYDIYLAAQSHEGHVTNGWYFAKTPSAAFGGPDYQDFLTPYTAVPEPITLMLVGLGLVGLVGARKKFRE